MYDPTFNTLKNKTNFFLPLRYLTCLPLPFYIEEIIYKKDYYTMYHLVILYKRYCRVLMVETSALPVQHYTLDLTTQAIFQYN